MPTGRGFGELHVDVGDVAYIREHPNFGLTRLALDDRLKLPVHRELHIALMIRERWSGRHIAARFGVCGGELLKIAGDELQLAPMIVD